MWGCRGFNCCWWWWLMNFTVIYKWRKLISYILKIWIDYNSTIQRLRSSFFHLKSSHKIRTKWKRKTVHRRLVKCARQPSCLQSFIPGNIVAATFWSLFWNRHPVALYSDHTRKLFLYFFCPPIPSFSYSITNPPHTSCSCLLLPFCLQPSPCTSLWKLFGLHRRSLNSSCIRALLVSSHQSNDNIPPASSSVSCWTHLSTVICDFWSFPPLWLDSSAVIHLKTGQESRKTLKSAWSESFRLSRF